MCGFLCIDAIFIDPAADTFDDVADDGFVDNFGDNNKASCYGHG